MLIKIIDKRFTTSEEIELVAKAHYVFLYQ